MRATFLTLLVLLPIAAVAPAQEPAQEMELPEAVPTEANLQFVAEVQAVFAKHPDAAMRYRLADFGPSPRWEVTWTCEDLGDFGVDCRPVAEPER